MTNREHQNKEISFEKYENLSLKLFSYPLLKDALSLGSKIFKTQIDKHKNKETIRSFSETLLNHDHSETFVVDYFNWFENDFVWKCGEGQLLGATYGELNHLWSNPDYFILYEAKQVLFKNQGGLINRVFVLEPKMSKPEFLLAFIRTIFRHVELGLDPKIFSCLDLKEAIKRININCDMFGVINGKVAYFIKYQKSGAPIMLRTTNKLLVQNAINAHFRLYRDSTSGIKWLNDYRLEVKSIMKMVEEDLKLINQFTIHTKIA